MKDTKLKIEINLNPSDKEMYGQGMALYHIIDLNLTKTTSFYKFFFGNEDAESYVYRGIWNVAHVKINNLELLIPYNTYKKDRTKSCLFSAFTGENMQILTNEDAIKIAACLILLVITFDLYGKGFARHFNSIYGDDELIELTSKLKSELYADEIIGRVAFNLLD